MFWHRSNKEGWLSKAEGARLITVAPQRIPDKDFSGYDLILWIEGDNISGFDRVVSKTFLVVGSFSTLLELMPETYKIGMVLPDGGIGTVTPNKVSLGRSLRNWLQTIFGERND